MKNCILLFALICFIEPSYSQVSKKVIVEHFTNTKCSVCASRNPGFYANYNAQSEVIHLAVHPSSPYNGCVFSQHNPSENDARTNYYGIYGSTPRLVIQGVVISGAANYGAASMFAPYLGQTSPASIKIVQSKFGNDSIRSRIVIKTEAAHTLPGLRLFVALAEDTINYTGSNGEPIHYDVFRKSLTGASGINVTLPAVVGDSIVYTKSSTVNAAWNFSKIFTLAILQDAVFKEVVQAQSISASSNATNIATGISHLQLSNTNISATIMDHNIVVKQEELSENSSLILFDISGRIMRHEVLTSTFQTIAIPEISAGIYLYALKRSEVIVKTGKLIVQ